jgi:fructose-specific phosphotransferase system IIC component
MKESLVKLRQYLLSGVSFAIPFVACGGIMVAAAIGINEHYSPDAPGNFDHSPALIKLIMDIGVASFTLMPAVLAGYISHAMAGKPGLVPGMVGGWLATHLGEQLMINGKLVEASAGFLGAMIAGLMAGYVVNLVKKTKVPRFVRPIMPIMVIPILCSSIVGVIMLKVLGIPIAHVMIHLGNWLDTMGKGNATLLAVILGVMIAFDMGGPINKTAFFFGVGLVTQGQFTVMGAIAAAICTPPLGMGLATMLNRKIWTGEEREAGVASFTMGLVGITEGAIPFAAADPLRVIPCLCIGSSLAAVIAMLGHVGDHAPHGGPIVLPVIDHRLVYVIAILTGALATALSINVLKWMSRREQAEVEQSAAAASLSV